MEIGLPAPAKAPGLVRRMLDIARSAHNDRALRNRLQSGFAWNVIAAVFNQGSTFALSLVVSNVLGRDQFGMFGLLQSTLLLISNIAQFAMGYTAAKYVAELRSSDKRRAARIVAASLFGAVAAAAAATLVGYFGASVIAARFLGQAELTPYIRLGAPAIGFIILGGIATGALTGFEGFRRIAVNGTVGGIIYIGLGAYAAMRWGLRGVVIAIVISSAIQSVYLLVQVIDEARRHGLLLGFAAFREIFEEAPMLINYAVPAALAGFSTAPTLWIVNATLARQANGLTQVALFTAANSIRLLIMFLPYLVNRVGFTLLNNYRGLNDRAGYQRAFWVNTAVVSGFTMTGLIAIILGAPFVMRAFGRSFVAGDTTLMIVAAATLPEAVAIGFFQIAQTRGLMWTSLFRIGIPRDLSIVGAAFLLVPHFGAAGAGLAFLIGATVFLIANLLVVRSIGISAQ